MIRVAAVGGAVVIATLWFFFAGLLVVSKLADVEFESEEEPWQ